MATEYPLRDKAGQIVALQDTRPPAPPETPAAEEPPDERTRPSRSIPVGQRRPLTETMAASPPATDASRARPISDGWKAPAVVGVAVLLIAAALLWPRAPAAALPAPTVTATAAPTRAPSATVQALARAVIAYAEPGGAALGAIEPGRAYDLVEESRGWRQLRVAGSGLVWVRSWEMDGLSPPTATPTASPVPTATAPPTAVWVPPSPVPTRDWAARPCEPQEVVGRAQSRGLLVESCISQADAERLLSELLQETAEANP